MIDLKNTTHGQALKVALVGVLVVLFTLLSILALAMIRNEWKEYDFIGKSAEFPHTITVAGEGKVTAVPDIAEVTIGVNTERGTVAEAQSENTRQMNNLIAEVKSQGIESADIQTTNYNIFPMYDYSNGRQTLRGYRVEQNVELKIRDLTKVSTILDIAGRTGANQVFGLRFTVDEPEQYRQEARVKAIEQAKQKAETLAQTAGVKLGDVVSFFESGKNQPPGPIPVYARAEGLGGNAAAPEIESGSSEIIVNASLTFEIL